MAGLPRRHQPEGQRREVSALLGALRAVRPPGWTALRRCVGARFAPLHRPSHAPPTAGAVGRPAGRLLQHYRHRRRSTAPSGPSRWRAARNGGGAGGGAADSASEGLVRLGDDGDLIVSPLAAEQIPADAEACAEVTSARLPRVQLPALL